MRTCACARARLHVCLDMCFACREAPAQLPIVTDQYFTSADVAGWQGRPRTTFPTAHDKDLLISLKPARSRLAEIA